MNPRKLKKNKSQKKTKVRKLRSREKSQNEVVEPTSPVEVNEGLYNALYGDRTAQYSLLDKLEGKGKFNSVGDEIDAMKRQQALQNFFDKTSAKSYKFRAADAYDKLNEILNQEVTKDSPVHNYYDDVKKIFGDRDEELQDFLSNEVLNDYLYRPADDPTKLYLKNEINKKIYDHGVRKFKDVPESLFDIEGVKNTLKIAKNDFDLLNKQRIYKYMAEGLTPNEAINKLVDLGMGNFNELERIFKNDAIQAQDKIIENISNQLDPALDTDIQKMAEEAREKYKDDMYFFDENQRNVEPASTTSHTVNKDKGINAPVDQSENIIDYGKALKDYKKELVDSGKTRSEKIKGLLDIEGSYQANQMWKQDQAYIDAGYVWVDGEWIAPRQAPELRPISDEELERSRNSIHNPYRKADWITKLLHPIDTLGHLAKYGNTDRMLEEDTGRGVWENNLVMQAGDAASWMSPVGWLRGAQMMGDGLKDLGDIAEHAIDYGGDVYATDFINPAVNIGFGRLAGGKGLTNAKNYVKQSLDPKARFAKKVFKNANFSPGTKGIGTELPKDWLNMTNEYMGNPYIESLLMPLEFQGVQDKVFGVDPAFKSDVDFDINKKAKGGELPKAFDGRTITRGLKTTLKDVKDNYDEFFPNLTRIDTKDPVRYIGSANLKDVQLKADAVKKLATALSFTHTPSAMEMLGKRIGLYSANDLNTPRARELSLDFFQGQADAIRKQAVIDALELQTSKGKPAFLDQDIFDILNNTQTNASITERQVFNPTTGRAEYIGRDQAKQMLAAEKKFIKENSRQDVINQYKSEIANFKNKYPDDMFSKASIESRRKGTDFDFERKMQTMARDNELDATPGNSFNRDAFKRFEDAGFFTPTELQPYFYNDNDFKNIDYTNILPMLMARNYDTPRDMASMMSRRFNTSVHGLNKDHLITGSTNTSEDSKIIQDRLMAKAVSNADKSGVLPYLIFAGYKPANDFGFLANYLNKTDRVTDPLQTMQLRGLLHELNAEKVFKKFGLSESALPSAIKDNELYLPHYFIKKSGEFIPPEERFKFPKGGVANDNESFIEAELDQNEINNLAKSGYIVEEI
jgi:hypothetical protein